LVVQIDFRPYICGTFIFISLGLVRLVSLMRKGWVVEPILLILQTFVFKTPLQINNQIKITFSNPLYF